MGKNLHMSQNFSLDIDVAGGNGVQMPMRRDGGIFSPANNGLASINENHRGNMLLTSNGSTSVHSPGDLQSMVLTKMHSPAKQPLHVNYESLVPGQTIQGIKSVLNNDPRTKTLLNRGKCFAEIGAAQSIQALQN